VRRMVRRGGWSTSWLAWLSRDLGSPAFKYCSLDFAKLLVKVYTSLIRKPRLKPGLAWASFVNIIGPMCTSF